MNIRDRSVLLITLLVIAVIIVVDLAIDFSEGKGLWHLIIESIAGVFALVGTFFVLKDIIRLKKDLNIERSVSAKFRKEAEEWRNRSKAYLDGLADLIDSQLMKWHLTPAEKEVAFLLLKGMSLKEVAQTRNTTEKTARVQSASIYSKSGLSGRSELAAFFLEDLLPPSK